MMVSKIIHVTRCSL